MNSILPGLKTHLVALSVILLGVGAWAHGDVTLMQGVDQILAGLGLSALRLGVAGSGK